MMTFGRGRATLEYFTLVGRLDNLFEIINVYFSFLGKWSYWWNSEPRRRTWSIGRKTLWHFIHYASQCKLQIITLLNLVCHYFQSYINWKSVSKIKLYKKISTFVNLVYQMMILVCQTLFLCHQWHTNSYSFGIKHFL